MTRCWKFYHPPRRNNDIFLEKVDFKEISQQLNFKDISALFAWSLPFFNSHQVPVSESLIRLEGGLLRRVKYNPKSPSLVLNVNGWKKIPNSHLAKYCLKKYNTTWNMVKVKRDFGISNGRLLQNQSFHQWK